MKKILFIIIICSGFSAIGQTVQNQTSKTYSTSCQLDSSAVFSIKYDNVSNSYVFYKILRYFYTYDANRNIINTLLLGIWGNDTTWANLNNFVNTYDTNNNLTDSLFQNWDHSTNQWKDNSWQHLIYDSNNNLISTTEQDIYISNWRNYSRTLNAFDINNKQISSKFQFWDNINNFWWSNDSTHYYYDVNNKLVSHSFYRSGYGTLPIWDYSGKDTIHYNLNNNPYYSLRQAWNNSNNTWRNYQQTAWNYYPNNIIKSILIDNWNVTNNQWEAYNYQYYTYDADNNIYHDSLGGPNGYYYTCAVAGINESGKEYISIIIYPTPTNSTLSIKSSLEYSSIKIVNSIGQTVLIFENKLEPISVSELQNGIYFIQILDKKGVVLKTEKFIKN